MHRSHPSRPNPCLRRLAGLALLALSAGTMAAPGFAQSIAWEEAAGHWGQINNHPPFEAVMWDPDGPGPEPRRLVVSLGFSIEMLAGNGEWVPLGSHGAMSIAVTANGDLVRNWTGTKQSLQPGISRYDPVSDSWVHFASANRRIWRLQTLPNGELVAAGEFTSIGGQAIRYLARLTSSGWKALASPTSALARYGTRLPNILDIQAAPNGNIYIAGGFGLTVNSRVRWYTVAYWDGAKWTPLVDSSPSPVLDGYASIAVHPNGTIYAGGRSGPIGSAITEVARWDGSKWVSLGLNPNRAAGYVGHLRFGPGGELIAYGAFTIQRGSSTLQNIARWDGSLWRSLGQGVSDFYESASGLLFDPGAARSYVWGNFTQAGPHRCAYLAAWDGQRWSIPGAALNAEVRSIIDAANPEEVLVGGAFTYGNGNELGHVARKTAQGFVPLGQGTDGPVNALLREAQGDVIAGGSFASAGGSPAANIARWDGSSWSPVGSGLNGEVHALCALPNGDLIAGGSFTSAGATPAQGLARFDGQQWSAVDPAFSGQVQALLLRSNGQLVVGGQFSTAPSASVAGVSLWDGQQWTDLGLANVHALAELRDGTLLAAGGPSCFLARWSGSNWSLTRLGGGPRIKALAALPNGDFVAGGNLIFSNTSTYCLARWNGSAFVPLATNQARPGAPVHALHFSREGRVWVGGEFYGEGSTTSPSSFLASCITDKPARATPRGKGCGANAPNQLEARSLPWLGSTYRSRASALPANALSLLLLGNAPVQFPLAPLVGAPFSSAPNCQLLATPDLVLPLSSGSGSIEIPLPIPADLGLLGLRLQQQLLSFDAGQFRVSSTPALDLTFGAF
jgi:hypothetical protein